MSKTGAPSRLIRVGRWQALDIDELTDDELTQAEELYPELGWFWAKFLASWIRDNVKEEK